MVQVILNICLPCMLICSISKNELKAGMFEDSLRMLSYSIIYFLVAALVSIFLVKIFRVKQSQDIGVYKVIFTSINCGFMGFPITKMIFGDEGLYFMVLHNIILNFYLYSLCTIQLNSGAQKGEILKALKSIINPCIISAVIGIVMLFAGVHLPEYLDNVLTPLGDSSIPMAMTLVGMQLAEGNIIKCFTNKKLILFSVVTMFVWPIVVLTVVKFIPMYSMVKTILVLGSALPPATTISALAANEGANYKLAADGIIITTLFTILSVPIITMLMSVFL